MAHREKKHSAGLRALLVVPAAVLPLLPSATCPVCLAAYAGVLSSLGLGFLLNDEVQRPLILVFLSITLGSVSWAAKHHRKFGPLLTVLLGSLAIVAARLVWRSSLVVYVGVALLVSGALWNLVLKRPLKKFIQPGIAERAT